MTLWHWQIIIFTITPNITSLSRSSSSLTVADHHQGWPPRSSGWTAELQSAADRPNMTGWPETVTKSLIAEQIHQMATHAEGQEELIWCGRHNSDSRFGTQLFSITSVVLVHIVKLGLCLSRAVISLRANNYNSANRFLKANYFCPITVPLLPAGGRKANISKARGRRI